MTRLSLWLHTRRQRRAARKPLILLRPTIRKARP